MQFITYAQNSIVLSQIVLIPGRTPNSVTTWFYY